MLQKWQNILIKCLSVILFIILFYSLSNSSYFSNSNNKYETFENAIENEKINYLKLNETYIEPQEKSLELLYTNYSGEEVGNSVWENKTLDQCTDICNNIAGCIGFTRDLVLDTEPAKCYPQNTINKCYSNRKGNLGQMQNAIKYNSFIKSDFPNVLNLCIGDSDLTLNRTIFIKSYSMPNKFLGINNDSRIVLIDKNINNFKTSSNFRIEKGQDGVGTVSFLHIDTGKYIFRDMSNILILKDISSGKTENKQRASFNLYDSTVGSGTIMLKSMLIEGETTDKFITLNNNYLNVIPLPNTNIDRSGSADSTGNIDNTIIEASTFYIVDSILNSNIITNKTDMTTMPTMSDMTTMPTMSDMTTMPTMSDMYTMPTMSDMYTMPTMSDMTTMPTMSDMYTMPTMSDMTTMPTMSNASIEPFTNTLDKSNDTVPYKKIFNPQDNLSLNNYLQDNYLTEYKTTPFYYSISNKINNITIKNQLNNSLTQSFDEYNSRLELNKEIEKEIANLNMDINAKNDKLVNNLDKMRITDLANDYFFLNSISKNNK
jgi:hypothetical protein